MVSPCLHLDAKKAKEQHQTVTPIFTTELSFHILAQKLLFLKKKILICMPLTVRNVQFRLLTNIGKQNTDHNI